MRIAEKSQKIPPTHTAEVIKKTLRTRGGAPNRATPGRGHRASAEIARGISARTWARTGIFDPIKG